MLSNLKLIFIHGVNNQSTNYSEGFFNKIQEALRKKLKARNLQDSKIDDVLKRIVRHEVMWADETTDLTGRYCQLAYQRPRFFWGRFTKPIDCLAMQIMNYIKDKGDHRTGPMSILNNVDEDFQKIFFNLNIGEYAEGEGKNAIIVSHSLGSVIAFDYVFCFRDKCRMDKSITIHSLITMGSPIPLFISAMGHTDSDLTLPANVKKWVNILSHRDGIARTMKPFFQKISIDEHKVRTSFWPIKSHGLYWQDGHTASIVADEALSALGLDHSK